MTREAEYALRAEARAVEAGRQARLNDDGSISVKSDSTEGVTYRVTFVPMDLVIKFSCTCPAGQHRRETVPCKHSAAAARRLEREGLARWVDGYWLITYKARDLMKGRRETTPTDPLKGLPGCN